MNKNTVRKNYDRLAPLYDLIFSRIFDDARKKSISKMNIKPNDRIIEIGVGTGVSLKHFNFSNNLSFTGIDLSEKMLEKAQHKADKYQNSNITLDCINGEDTPYNNSTFDKVILMYVYSVTPNPEKLIEESIRICKDNGSIYIINHFSNSKNNNLNIFEKILSNWSDVIGFRSDFSYANHIERYNLTIESVISANLFSITKIIHFKKNKNTHILKQK